jgi:pimeloyl-ACP methyl ester carboxylesterase
VEATRGTAVSADGTRIGLVTGGAGAPLLLVHGGACTAERWGPLWPLLAAHRQVTAMDRRGRGASPDLGPGVPYAIEREGDDVAAVAEFLAAQAGRSVDVLGHSYGAVCALFAAAVGAPIGRLVLVEPPGPQTLPQGWVGRLEALLEAGRAGAAMASFLVEVVGLSGEQVLGLRERAAGNGPDPLPVVQATLLREARALASLDLSAVAARVAQPVLLVHGTRSPV